MDTYVPLPLPSLHRAQLLAGQRSHLHVFRTTPSSRTLPTLPLGHSHLYLLPALLSSRSRVPNPLLASNEHNVRLRQQRSQQRKQRQPVTCILGVNNINTLNNKKSKRCYLMILGEF